MDLYGRLIGGKRPDLRPIFCRCRAGRFLSGRYGEPAALRGPPVRQSNSGVGGLGHGRRPCGAVEFIRMWRFRILDRATVLLTAPTPSTRISSIVAPANDAAWLITPPCFSLESFIFYDIISPCLLSGSANGADVLGPGEGRQGSALAPRNHPAPSSVMLPNSTQRRPHWNRGPRARE